jgi:hypothetical protein
LIWEAVPQAEPCEQACRAASKLAAGAEGPAYSFMISLAIEVAWLFDFDGPVGALVMMQPPQQELPRRLPSFSI